MKLNINQVPHFWTSTHRTFHPVITATSTTDAMLAQRDPSTHLMELPAVGSVICSCYGRRMRVLEAYVLNEAEAREQRRSPGAFVVVTPCEKLRWRQTVEWRLESCFPETEEQLELF